MIALSAAAKSVSDSIDQLSPEDRRAVGEAHRRDLFPEDDKSRTQIWVVLLIGLFVLGLAAIIGAIVFAMAGKDFAGVIAVGTAIVGGVIGLFSKSPAS